MILSDADIRRRLTDGDLVVEPLDDPELQIQPASIDLRLEGRYNQKRLSLYHNSEERDIYPPSSSRQL